MSHFVLDRCSETPELQKIKTLDTPCLHPLDLRSQQTKGSEQHYCCTICGAVRVDRLVGGKVVRGSWSAAPRLSSVENM